MKQSLRKYVGKRIRLLRLKKGFTQEQIEERADLGTNYVYKLEHLETNITINTLEKVMNALECDISSFFDITKKDENPEIFEVASAQLGLTPKDCVGVEDSIAGIEAINSAGSCSVGVGDETLSQAFKRVESTKELTVTLLQEAWNNFVKEKI